MSLKQLLEEKNISGYEIAKNTTVKQQTLSDYVTGKNINSMKFGMAKTIADYLNITLDELYKICKEN